MNTMNMPGFTAETSLYETSGHYQSVTTQSYSSGGQGVISQLRVLPPLRGGGGGFWGCGTLCDIAYGACLLACAATGPAALACVATCTFLYDHCSDGCVSGGGGIILQ
jgi:hypothetical protein